MQAASNVPTFSGGMLNSAGRSIVAGANADVVATEVSEAEVVM